MPSIKEIYNSIGEVELNADQINLNVDGLEALASTQQADIALIKADVDDIRVDLANGVTLTSAGTTGSTAPTNANLVGGTDGTNLRAFSTDTAGKLQTIANNSDSFLISYDFTGAISVNTVLIPSTDVGSYAEASVQAVSMGTSLVVRFQYSNDNSTWVTAPIQILTDASTTPVTQFSSASIYKLPLFGAKYMRAIASTGASAGTTTLRVYLNPRTSTAISQAVNIANSGTNLNTIPTPSNAQGHQTFHTNISASGTNATLIRSSPTNIGFIHLYNTSSVVRYFKGYNTNSLPTVGTNTPFLNYAIPPNSNLNIDTGWAGIRLNFGFAYAITGGQALLDSTSINAGEVMVNMAYV